MRGKAGNAFTCPLQTCGPHVTLIKAHVEDCRFGGKILFPVLSKVG